MTPRFSARVPGALTENALARAFAARRAAGREILDLTVSNPTSVGLPVLTLPSGDRDAASAAYRPEPRGDAAALTAVSALWLGRGVAADPGALVLCSSTSEAYGWLFKLLADPGDEILVPRPSYPLFEHLARLESVVTRTYPLHEEGGWHLDIDALERAVSARTRAIVTVNPNNPTGSCLQPHERDALVRIAAAHRLAVISDEVFADYPCAPRPGAVRTLAAEDRALCFVLDGLSKTLAQPQMKVAWILISGPREASRAALERLEWIADSYLPVSAPLASALPALLAQAPAAQAAVRARRDGNLRALETASARTRAASVLPVEGGWTAVLRAPGTRTDEEWALRLLEQDGVLVHPGHFYDFEQEARLVVSLLPEPEVFSAGLERIVTRLGEV